MDAISEINESNRGGGNYILYASTDLIDLENFPEEIDSNIGTDISFLDPQEGFRKAQFTKNTLLFNEEPKDDGGFSSTISAIIPKDRVDIINLFRKLEKQRHIIIYVDNNGTSILIGNEREAAQFLITKRNHKEDPRKRNEYEVQIICNRRKRSPFYLGTLESIAGETLFVTATIPNASTTKKGVVEEATTAEVNSGTASGSEARLFVNPEKLEESKYLDNTGLKNTLEGLSSGVTGVYTANAPNGVTIGNYYFGQSFKILFGYTNAGTPTTINIDGKGVKGVKINGNENLPAGYINPGQMYWIVYDGGVFQLLTSGEQNSKKGSIGITLDGGGSVIGTGAYGSITMNHSGVIEGWDLFEHSDAPIAGSIVIDAWKDTYANYPPTVADTIFGTKPSLTAATKNTASGLNIAFSAGDVFRFNVDSASSVKRVTLILKTKKN